MCASLCKPDEVVYFSCKIKLSSKTASLCGGPLKDTKGHSLLESGWLQYRFGKQDGPVELVFPTNKTGSVKQFKGETHSYLGENNIRGYNDRVWFSTRNANYGVIIDQGDEAFFGVRVFVGEKRTDIPCDKDIDFGSLRGNSFQALVRELRPIE
jgi:hypothetical protein